MCAHRVLQCGELLLLQLCNTVSRAAMQQASKLKALPYAQRGYSWSCVLLSGCKKGVICSCRADLHLLRYVLMLRWATQRVVLVTLSSTTTETWQSATSA